MKKILAELLLQTVTSVLQTSITVLIEKHKELHGPERNKQLKGAILNSFELLKDVTNKTKTNIDDTIVEIVINGTMEAK